MLYRWFAEDFRRNFLQLLALELYMTVVHLGLFERFLVVWSFYLDLGFALITAIIRIRLHLPEKFINNYKHFVQEHLGSPLVTLDALELEVFTLMFGLFESDSKDNLCIFQPHSIL